MERREWKSHLLDDDTAEAVTDKDNGTGFIFLDAKLHLARVPRFQPR